jgi:hypothetical protein
VILTKVDGDSRVVRRCRCGTSRVKPIKFLGVEKTDAWSLSMIGPSRILGMGVLLSLIEQAEQKLGWDKAEKLAKLMKRRENAQDTDSFFCQYFVRDLGCFMIMRLRDKKVVGVFVRFSCATSFTSNDEFLANNSLHIQPSPKTESPI